MKSLLSIFSAASTTGLLGQGLYTLPASAGEKATAKSSFPTNEHLWLCHGECACNMHIDQNME